MFTHAYTTCVYLRLDYLVFNFPHFSITCIRVRVLNFKFSHSDCREITSFTAGRRDAIKSPKLTQIGEHADEIAS